MEPDKLDELKELVNSTIIYSGADPTKEFKPFVFYAKSFDRVTLVTRDCSMTEQYPIAKAPFILLIDDYPELFDSNCAGFMIDGAGSYAREHGLVNKDGQVEVVKLLEALSEKFPGLIQCVIMAETMVRTYGLTTVTIY